MGGIGKTELALQYALNDRDKEAEKRTYQAGICWVNVSDKGNVGTQILNFARNYLMIPILEEGELEERVKHCWQNWRPGNTLIIFDNVKELDQIQDFLPPESRRFKVIITTRNTKLRNNFKLLELEILALESAIKLLASFIGNQRIEKERKKAEKLCQWLGYLPLGIELVGRYLEETEDKINNVYKKLEKQKLKDESLERPKNQLMTAQRGVLPAFKLSWEELSEEAKQLGAFLGLFEVKPIPWEIIESNISKLTRKPTSKVEQLFPTLSQIFLRKKNIELNQSQKKLRELAKLSLIKKTGEQVYEVHTLIHQYLRDKLEESELATSAKQTYCQLMTAIAQEIPDTPTRVFQSFDRIMPHLEEAVTALPNWLSNEDLIKIYSSLGIFYECLGLYSDAQKWFEESLLISQKHCRNNAQDVAISLNHLALLDLYQGHWQDAHDKCQQARSLLFNKISIESDEQDNYFVKIRTLTNLGIIYTNQGAWNEAIKAYEEALKICQNLKEPQEQARTLANLANVYRLQGDGEKATSNYKKALKIFGERHSTIPIIWLLLREINSIAGILFLRKSLSKWGNYRREGQTLIALGNLALQQGNLDEAYKKYQTSLNIFSELKDPRGESQALGNLSNLCLLQGRWDELDEKQQKALDIFCNLVDPKNKATTLINQGIFCRLRGNLEEAQKKYQEALKIFRNIGDRQGEGQVLMSLGNIDAEQGEWDLAREKYFQVQGLFTQLGDCEGQGFALMNLGNICRCQGRQGEARQLFSQALEIFRRIGFRLGEGLVLMNQCRLHTDQGRWKESLNRCNEALGIFRELENLQYEGESLGDLGKIYLRQGKKEMAVAQWQQALTLLPVDSLAHKRINELLKSAG